MIREADGCFLESLTPDTEAKLKIRALWEAYGAGRSFVRFYAGDGGTVIALMDGTAVVAMGEEPVEEAVLFLSMNPEVRSVRTDAAFALQMADFWGTAASIGTVMTPSVHPVADERVEETVPRDIYASLYAVFGDSLPPFDSWYADVHSRFRQGRCRIAAINRDGHVAATAMTTAECEGAALIGAVATLPAFRGQGFASACVRTLTARLLDEGKRVLLSPKNERAAVLYRKLGFVPCGSYGSVSREITN